jgi:xanthine dehydrogenase accessory factor
MRTNKAHGRPVAIVVGADDAGSAVAVALHRVGFATVLCDDIDPPWARRGMSFTNAWYFGNAELDGEAAICCSNVKSIAPVLRRDSMIAATPWSWHGIALALEPVAIVQSRSTRRREGSAFKARAPEGCVTIGIGADCVGEDDFDVVVASGHEEAAGMIGADQTRGFGTGTAIFVGTADRGQIVCAPKSGRFATNRRIGDHVRQGQIVGAIGDSDVAAPIDGVLRGLSARGAAVFEGAIIVEVDPRGDPALCFGIDEHAWRIARSVISALAQRLHGTVPVPEGRIVPAAAHAV